MTIATIGGVILLLVFLQGWLYKKFWRRGFSASVYFSAKEAFEGDKMTLNQEFENRKLLPLPWVFIEFQLSQRLIFSEDFVSGEDGFKRDLFAIKTFQKIRRKIPFVASRRGFYTLKEVNLKASNLLHTKRYEGFFSTYKELTVFPKILDDDHEIALAYKNLDAMILSNALTNPDPFEFRGIRDYHPTDALKDINFKASAIGQQLMVNIHAPVAAQRLEIVLNLQRYSTSDYKEVHEQAIRLAATIAAHYIDQDVQVGLYTNGRDNNSRKIAALPLGQSAAHLYNILTALAHINLSNVPVPIAPYLETISKPDAVYVIISSYYGEDLTAAMGQMKDAGVVHHMFMPVESRFAPIADVCDEITVWEATG
ncbi:MAG: DUF58 domain-containing protein [Defluviitaleaceae bacterium]|nr:DUF58 domain-containing protein [Defluviitaleaceae bacterium]